VAHGRAGDKKHRPSQNQGDKMKKVGELNGQMLVAITPQEVAEVASLIKKLSDAFEPVVAHNGYVDETVRSSVKRNRGIKVETAAKPDNPKRHKTCTICHNDYIDQSKTNTRKRCYKCMPE